MTGGATYHEVGRIDIAETVVMRLSQLLNRSSDVVHVVEVNDSVIEDADDPHRVRFELLAAPQFS